MQERSCSVRWIYKQNHTKISSYHALENEILNRVSARKIASAEIRDALEKERLDAETLIITNI